MRRVLLTETLDPNGALCRWMSPDIQRLGWHVTRLPTQEAIHCLGPEAYPETVLQIVRELRPHVLLVHPPYDHLPPLICRQIRALGTRIVALAFDDPLFAAQWGEDTYADFRERFDRWASTLLSGPSIEAGALPLRWAMSREAVAADAPSATSHEVLLVGRRNDSRAAVIQAVTEAGYEVGVYGAGWPNGSIDRAQMLGLLRRASVVITPNDGTGMIKARLLETALVGAAQVVEHSPDLPAYFPETLPPVWQSPAECVAAIPHARPIAISDVDWGHRWEELLSGLHLAEDLPISVSQSGTLRRLLLTLAHQLEQRGKWAAAAAFFAEAHNERGLARIAHAEERWEAALRHALHALEQVPAWPAVHCLHAFVPAHGQGTGLGRTGALDPSLELEAIALNARLRLGQLEACEQYLTQLPQRRRRALATILQPDHKPEHARIWQLVHGT